MYRILLKTILAAAILYAFLNCSEDASVDPVGKYRYLHTSYCGKGCWAWEYTTEELLSIRSDSIYYLEHIRPQGGFEVLPDSGTWKVKGQELILLSVADTEWKSESYLKRRFHIDTKGLKEKGRRLRSDRILWKKE